MNIKLIIAIFLSLLIIPSISAQTLKEIVRGTLISNPDVQSLRLNTKAYRLYVDEEEGKLYPTLDFDTYFENTNTNKDGTSSSKSGTNTQLSLEQTLFDGWLTSSKIDEADFNYQSTKISNISLIESVVLDSVKAYLDVVKNHEFILLSENNLSIHEQYLEVAMQSEVVSGDTLDRMQVESKISAVLAKFSEVKRDNIEARATLEKLYGKALNNSYCRPVVINNEFSDLEETISKAMVVNYSIQEEIQKIKKQRAIVSQEKSRFMPTLKVKLLHEIDDGADVENVKKTEDSVRLSLSYNIFNGLQDKVIHQREKLFLQESQKVLDNVVKKVIEDIKINYTRFQTSKKRVIYLKEYLSKNKDILMVYLEQFQGGTRSFVDILNHEAELFRAKTDLIEEQFTYTSSYYELKNLLSSLSTSILSSQKQICEEIKVDIEKRNIGDNEEEDAELALLLEDEGDEDSVVGSKGKDGKAQKVQSILDRILKEIYDPNSVNKNINISNISNKQNKRSAEIGQKDKPTAQEKIELEKRIKEQQEIEEQNIREEQSVLKEQIRVEAQKLLEDPTLKLSSEEIIKKEEKKLEKLQLTTKEKQAISRRIGAEYRKKYADNIAKNKALKNANQIIKTEKEKQKYSIKKDINEDLKELERLEKLVEKKLKAREINQKIVKPKEVKAKAIETKMEVIDTRFDKLEKNKEKNESTKNAWISSLWTPFNVIEQIKTKTKTEKIIELKKEKESNNENKSLVLNQPLKMIKEEKPKKEEKIKQESTVSPQIQETLKSDKPKALKRVVKSKKESKRVLSALAQEIKKTKTKKYTIAILSITKKKTVNQIRRAYKLTGNIFIYASQSNGTKYYKVLYGLYDSFAEAKEEIVNLNKKLQKSGVFINKVSKHQKLYKKYNSNKEIKEIDKKRGKIRSIFKDVNVGAVVKNSTDKLEIEFKTTKSDKYTLAISTMKTYTKPSFIKKQYNLIKSILIYKSKNNGINYYKVLYGVYESANEAKLDMKNLPKALLKNGVFINKISKHQKLFKKYNSIGGK